jgi:hypothetical protein
LNGKKILTLPNVSANTWRKTPKKIEIMLSILSARCVIMRDEDLSESYAQAVQITVLYRLNQFLLSSETAS